MLVLHFWTDVRIIPCCQLGVFEMSQLGLAVVSNPSEIFLTEQHSDSDFLAGLAVAVIMDGSRSFLIEIQVIFIITFYTSYFLKILCMQWIHHYLRMRSPMMILLRFPFFFSFVHLFIFTKCWWSIKTFIQALCVSGSSVSRHINGIQSSRADMIISVSNLRLW
jgi:hypothetical protein